MRENIVKNILVTLNILMWISGWIVLALSVHMMVGNHARYYTAILLGSEPQLLSSGPHQTPSVLDPGWLDNSDPQIPATSGSDSDSGGGGGGRANEVEVVENKASIEDLVLSDAAGTLKAEGTLLVAGAVVVVAGLLGCIASSQRDKTLLLAYGCLMIASGLLEAGVCIWCFLDSDASSQLEDYPLPFNASAPSPSLGSSGEALEVAYLPTDEGGDSAIEAVLHLKAWYGQPAYEEYTRVVDHVQERLSCCGLTGPKDYLSSVWEDQANASFDVVPRSCCLTILPEDAAAVSAGGAGAIQGSAAVAAPEGSWREYGGQGGCDMQKLSQRHSKGCLHLLPSWVKQNFAATGGALLVVSLFQISGAVATILLRKQFKSFGCRDLPPIETLLF
ncbi:uncharacterized protein LOC122247776 isoform X2 [Penaeus japonicus]|uniref:uncharacterized protein LOC122247776 isoform X1 n=1 Tax=Penaeus japonicus TaxID=27405 RepID=UPI001C7165C6|nr:uncharacterized protein LOC122247776 isoform X1 [Penaeus japonicus]XP_042863290.1 uncharacterized protein LOC122247776 isoform X2 [Penaeus japonicus]